MQLERHWESVRIGLESLRAHPLRTLLSTSGVVIGVLALVGTLSVTDGVDRWSRQLIERESSVQDIVVSSRHTIMQDGIARSVRHAPVFTLDDWQSARGAIPHVSAALLSVTGPTRVSANSRQRKVLLTASTPNLPSFAGIIVGAGRFYGDVDMTRQSNVVVLGHRLADELALPHDPAWLIGRTIRLGGVRREVIGVLAERPGETDLVAFAPLSRRVEFADAPATQVTPILRLKARTVENVPDAKSAAIDWIAERFPLEREALEVSVGLERLQNTEQAILLTKLIFGFLVALMLAIGGIGIMNVLLASVAERTREIGIRKSAGATRNDILWHFLAESIAISGMGTAVGIALGVVVSLGATAVFRQLTGAPIHPVFNPETFVLAAFSAVAVGLCFGTYPARVASRLTPIEAIQRD